MLDRRVFRRFSSATLAAVCWNVVEQPMMSKSSFRMASTSLSTHAAAVSSNFRISPSSMSG